ncbi:alpha/beta-hydrolase [Xylona heveae TC161]|uniref:Alpha/beta-hydrolase n=1 Tax=Xylona heveae (strain CBS 132557 / TC161) TaxID=1328760 RepID=A0A165G288_XYLHT|nr:alpha/beta-hydrolase [Xylona heveae TC161]KZF21655.1 alpha/beta-hydrolase [Xylona heveae TC161]
MPWKRGSSKAKVEERTNCSQPPNPPAMETPCTTSLDQASSPAAYNDNSIPNSPPVRSSSGSWEDLASIAQALKQVTKHHENLGSRTWQRMTVRANDLGHAMTNKVLSKLNIVITSIDEEQFNGNEHDLEINDQIRSESPPPQAEDPGSFEIPHSSGTNYFAKVSLYRNSKLPAELPPLKLHPDAWPLLCLASQFSERVYQKPVGAERLTHVEASLRKGTKAMVIKSVPVDDVQTIVFAIRGSQTFLDWAVNLQTAPASPVRFLDDATNLCHQGFLAVARKMVSPVAARLRALLEEDPSRSQCSLLITGHSAGGAVASLLYAHMLAQNVNSELDFVKNCFQCIHCITFGAPPVSQKPITKPDQPTVLNNSVPATSSINSGKSHRQPPHIPWLNESLFLSFINEGDPVVRADKAYVRSLVDLYLTPIPAALGGTCVADIVQPVANTLRLNRLPKLPSSLDLRISSGSTHPHRQPPNARMSQTRVRTLTWQLPPPLLCNAGMPVLLRDDKGGSLNDSQENSIHAYAAYVISTQQLRGVVFGDPMMHMMTEYAKRIDTMATSAVISALGY